MIYALKKLKVIVMTPTGRKENSESPVYLINRSKINYMLQRIIYRPKQCVPCDKRLDENTTPKLRNINTLKTNGRLLYLKTQSVPRCKHFSSRL
jgi:hypothetical protein